MFQRIWLAIALALFTVSAANAQTNTKGVQFNNQAASPCGVTLSCLYTTSTGGTFYSTAADGASATGFAINTSTGWTNATARLIKASTNAVEHFAVYASGLIESSWERNTSIAQTAGLILANTSSATTGAQQYSPVVFLYGQRFNGAVTKQAGWGLQAQSVGDGTDAGRLRIYGVYDGSNTAIVDIEANSGDPQIKGTAGGAYIRLGSSGNMNLGAPGGYVVPVGGGSTYLGSGGNYWLGLYTVDVFAGGAAGIGGAGSGAGIISIANATTAPTTNPGSGGILYAEGGALKWRSAGGTVTTVAPN